ncbi:MAG: hypothetical protein F4Y98_09375 [Chloroflexi bacterium]|nr:hypothetical protein [Chloroflexota bacterium]
MDARHAREEDRHDADTTRGRETPHPLGPTESASSPRCPRDADARAHADRVDRPRRVPARPRPPPRGGRRRPGPRPPMGRPRHARPRRIDAVRRARLPPRRGRYRARRGGCGNAARAHRDRVHAR